MFSESELTNVAIGKNQPIAPNDTERGRALNRCVEFIISPAQSANFAAVQQVVVQRDFLKLSKNDATPAVETQSIALVYKTLPNAGLWDMVDDNKVNMVPAGGVKLNPASNEHGDAREHSNDSKVNENSALQVASPSTAGSFTAAIRCASFGA